MVSSDVVANPFGDQSSAEVAYSDAGLVRYAAATERKPTAYAPATIATMQSLTGECNALNFSTALKYAEEKIAISAASGADVMVMWEEYWPTCDAPANHTCLALQQQALDWCAAQSQKHRMWLLCPMHYHETDASGTATGTHLNSVFVYNRTGAVVGRYDKLFPVYQPANMLQTEDRDPSTRGVQVFDSDFGFRFCIIVCNDIMFQEVPAQCQALGADLIFWPAAWKGGRHADAMAAVNNVHVVNSPNGCGGGDARIVDHTGTVIPDSALLHNDTHLKIVQLDPEETIVHENVHSDLVTQLETDFDITGTIGPISEWFIFKASANATGPVPVRHALRSLGIPTINELRRWSREGVNMARMQQAHMPQEHPVYPAKPGI